MTEYIKVDDVKANDILIWSELEERFVNIEPSLENLNIPPLEVKLQQLSPNAQIIKSIGDGDTVQQRGLIAGKNIDISVNSTDIIISADFDGDAETLSGFTHMDFVKRSELNDLIDVNEILEGSDVYTRAHAHDVFMESNASNIPDKDNVYDLGSNGRRYADIFAVTFHGTATKAIVSQGLTQNGANEGDILTWSENKWRPMASPPIKIDRIESLELSKAKHNDIIQYDSTSGKWKSASVDAIAATIDVPRNHFRNVGNDGVGILHQVYGLDVQLRSLVSGEGIHIQEDPNDDRHVVISLDEAFIESLEFTTDEVSEGNGNLYFTNERVISTIENELKIGSLKFVDTTKMESGKVAYWDGSKISFMEIEIPEVITSVMESEDVDADEIEEDQVLVWDGSKFVPFTIPENTDILADVDTSDATGKFLTWDGSTFGFEEVSIGMTLDDVDTSRANDGHVLTWNGNTFVLREVGEGGAPVPSDMLSEVNTTNAANGYVLTWNGSGYVLSEIPRQEFELGNLTDVESSADDGQVLTYDGSKYRFLDIPEKDAEFSHLTDVNQEVSEGQYFTFADGEFKFTDLPEIPEIPETFSVSVIDEFESLEEGKLLKVENGKIVGTDVNVPSGISDLSDVSIGAIEDGKMLGTSGGSIVLMDIPEFEQHDIALEDVTNVTGGSENGQVLTFRNGNYVFENIEFPEHEEKTYSLNELTDVDVSNPVEGQVLTYSGGTFSLQTPSEGVSALTDLSDVNTTSLNTGRFLQWNGSEFVFSEISIPEMPDAPEAITKITELEDVNISNLEDGKMLTVSGGNVVLSDIPDQANSKLFEMEDVDIEILETGHYLKWDGSSFVLSEITIPDNSMNLNDIMDVDTSGASNGQVLTFNGTGYSFQTVTSGDGGVSNFVELNDVNISSLSNDKYIGVQDGKLVEKDLPDFNVLSANDVNTSNAQNDYVLSYENGSLVFKALPEHETISDVNDLDNVNISGATNGQILTINNGNIVATDMPEIPEAVELEVLKANDVDSNATNGQVLTYRDGTLVFETIEVPPQVEVIDEFVNLTDVNISSLTDDNYLKVSDGKIVQAPLDIKSNVSEMNDVTISGATEGQVLTWDGSGFVLSNVEVGNTVESITELDDVDETVQPQDGDILTYDSSKGKYAPLPIDLSGVGGGSSGGGYPNTARYEIVRLNHRPDDGLDEVIPYTDGIVHSGTPDPDFNIVEFQFPGYRYPPLSVFTYGYVYEQNYYNITPVLLTQERLRLNGLGEPGAPLAFEERDENNPYTFTVSARTSETNASRSGGFPPKPTHTFIVFVMGG